MGRPLKNNADYFPHDADMRNDAKIKAVRRKYGVEGYGLYNMVLEYLTDSEHFKFTFDDLNIELMAGDFDTKPELLREVLQYCLTLNLLQIDQQTGVIACKSLDNRLEPLLSKRKRDRTVVIAGENTQSKVEYSKVKKRRVEQLAPVDVLRDAMLVEWSAWGDLIVNDRDQHWHAIKGRKINREEMDNFISVAARKDWKMDSQQLFRVTLKGFDAKRLEFGSGNGKARNPGKLQ